MLLGFQRSHWPPGCRHGVGIAGFWVLWWLCEFVVLGFWLCASADKCPSKAARVRAASAARREDHIAPESVRNTKTTFATKVLETCRMEYRPQSVPCRCWS